MAESEKLKESQPYAPQRYSLRWLFLSFKGRISRQSFIFACLFDLVLLFIAVNQLIQGSELVKTGGSDGRLVFASFFAIAVLVFSFWSMLAVTVKRLHDGNLPAALVLILFFTPVNFFFVIYLMAAPSHKETNRHGAPPFPAMNS